MAEPTRSQLKLHIQLLSEFVQKYGRHDELCAWVTVHGSCTCGFDKQLERLRDSIQLLHGPDEARALLKAARVSGNGAGA